MKIALLVIAGLSMGLGFMLTAVPVLIIVWRESEILGITYVVGWVVFLIGSIMKDFLK